MAVSNTKKTNVTGQVSAQSAEMTADAFLRCLREDRESRVSGFSQAMGEEEFARFAEALKLFDDRQNVMSEAFEHRLGQYFDALVSFLETAMEKQNNGSEDSLLYGQAVEELYLVNCERVRKDNSYRIFYNHPILLMNQRLDAEVTGILEKKRAEAAESDFAKANSEILQFVFEAKMKNRCRMKLYGRNQVYETERGEHAGEEGFVCARPFEQLEDCTEIPAIRIWEKIKNYQELHQERNLNEINIAVFGNLAEDSLQKELLEKLSGIKVNWTFFRHEPMTGEYFFADDGGELYDLLDMRDLQTLTGRYEIISFLDQNCFYRQGQAEKDEKEKGADTICRWNFERSRTQEKFKDKAAYYQAIYNRVGQWINSFDKAKSASFEFDERLYRNLEVVPKENTDIYLYIRYSDRISGYDLSNNGICNDEYYGGISLTVCRLTKFDKPQFNEDYGRFLDESGENEENREGRLSVPIRFWKLLKSISNEYCDEILRRYGGEDIERLRNIILFLNESFLIVEYRINAKDEKVTVQYELQVKEAEKYSELQAEMANIAKVILNYALGEEELYCMNRYFERLLIHSVISNANDVGDLIFAYWMATHWYTIDELKEAAVRPRREIDFRKDIVGNSPGGQRNRFKVKKTIYSVIKRLADMRIRDIPDMQKYFSASFHGKVCPEVTDRNLMRTFQTIREYCEYLQYTGSYLYLNSGLLMGE